MTWRERIVEARERGCFTKMDWYDAHDFSSCAVGEQRLALPGVVVMMDDCEAPDDDMLYSLGYAFFWKAVKVDDFTEAERLLDAIEDRVLVLKREAE